MEQEAMTSKIQEFIQKSHKKPAFMPFIEIGYPDLEFSKKLFLLFQEKGAAAIEVGIPFSDPLADGPVIQKASKIALQNGINLKKVFQFLGEIKQEITIPLILFSYLNPVMSFGFENFIKEMKDKEISGLIIPDLPPEEAEELSILCRKNGIDLIFLVSPASAKERIKTISQSSSGFIYLVSSTGVTGVRDSFSKILSDIYSEIKTHTSLPVAVGFGVSKPEHIQELKKIGVEAAVIASAFIKIIDKHIEDKDFALKKIDEYIDSLLGL